jgi:DNA gyrase/topoisomerase IV subunit A
MKLVLAKDLEGDELVKTLKLYTYLSTSNMNLFNHEERLVHFNEVHEICDAFLDQRLGYYQKRKDAILKQLTQEILVLHNKHRYIQELLAETIDLRRKSSAQITEILLQKKYDMQDETYHYLTKMSMDSVCEENVDHLKKQYETKQKEKAETEAVSKEQMWIQELKELDHMLS